MKKQFWNTNQCAVWIAAPSIALALTFIITGVTNDWTFSRNGYWDLQDGWFTTLNAYLSVLPSSLWSNLTMLGDGSVLLPILAPLIIWRRRYFFAVIASAPSAAIFSVIGKKVAGIPRPAAVLDHNTFNIIGETLTSHNSFPSGHSITVFAALVAIAASAYSNSKYISDSKIIWLTLMIATVLGLSRIAVGAHWPLDVVAGASLGWFAGLLGVAISRRSSAEWFYSIRGSRILGLLLAALCYSLIQRGLASSNANLPILWLSILCGLITSAYLLSQNKKGFSRYFMVYKNKILEN
ncbi:phosphatase PAP2 family protein [Marinagarivorans cellulosilyticus]|uniref:undecaprenyl-diphosphate phosphatase n=1 Tax=Marinagarivorans cellulosilyticus TaxID=2721545 RepID=A0AAN1WEY5_9GAMM|nr:phosphatase PAP2 family protein [Marinagarivorans cellulosilyticus]BCD96356.1 hypothetical protein MARGE09_P0556 [Marinagarivorans cellulosilyticus]